MKKTYQRPDITVIDLNAEKPFLGLSNLNVDKDTDLDAGNAYSRKKNNFWDNKPWGNDPWNNDLENND